MKRLSFWAIFQNTDFSALNCQTAKCPKFSSGESQKLDKITKFASPNQQKATKMIIISRLWCLSTV